MVERGPGRPNEYLLKDGSSVPSVTTIIGRFKSSVKLLYWAWKKGLEGKDYRLVRDRAAVLGNCVHDGCELVAHDEKWKPKPDEDHIADRVYQATEAFKKWHDQSNYTWIATEVPFVSEVHKFGGTLDGIVKEDGRLLMFDIKTSKKVYIDHLIQLGAYKILWEECREDIIEGGIVVQVVPGDPELKKKTKIKVTKFTQDDLELGAQVFLIMRKLYGLVQELEGRLP